MTLCTTMYLETHDTRNGNTVEGHDKDRSDGEFETPAVGRFEEKPILWYIVIHCYTLVNIRCCTLPDIAIHCINCRILLYTAVHCFTLLYTLLYTTIHRFKIQVDGAKGISEKQH